MTWIRIQCVEHIAQEQQQQGMQEELSRGLWHIGVSFSAELTSMAVTEAIWYRSA